jgi:protein TonB
MSREWLIAGAVALLFHGLLLFAFHLETAAAPHPMADTAVDVDLVAAPPAPAPVAEVAPPPPQPPPPPEVVPPDLTPPPPLPEPAPIPESPPAVDQKPAPRPMVKPNHPGAPAARTVRPALAAPGAAAAAGPHGGVSSPVRPRFNPKPEYPAEARRLGQQGRVILEVEVGADGRAANVSVKRSSGFPALDSAAVQGVRRWTFDPARVAGLPVVSRADVPVNFSLAQ